MLEALKTWANTGAYDDAEPLQIQRLRLEDGDTVILRVPGNVSQLRQKNFTKVGNQLHELLGCPVLIIQNDIDISRITREQRKVIHEALGSNTTGPKLAQGIKTFNQALGNFKASYGGRK
jgi:hypothetical protein